MNVVYGLFWILATVKWGDVKNWKKYYPTILFFALGDFLYLYLLSDFYPMWKYVPQGLDKYFGLTGTQISLASIFIKYPATILIYLSKFPDKNKFKQLLYMLGWVLIYFFNELIDVKLNQFKYFNGWNLYWSTLFTIVMFMLFRIHHTRPLLAWFFSFLFIIFLWQVFDVPSKVFR